ncbi:MAG: hypothetical protein ACQEXJ_18360 [Myxococcota bacterium]
MRRVDARLLSVVALPLLVGLLGLSVLVGTGCSSCGKDDEEAPEAPTAEEAAPEEAPAEQEAPAAEEDATRAAGEGDAARAGGAPTAGAEDAARPGAPLPPEPTRPGEAEGDASQGAKPGAAEDAKPGAAEDEEAGGGEEAEDGPLSPMEKRRKDREERIAELKRRNEERRKERQARLAERYEGEEAGAEEEAKPGESEEKPGESEEKPSEEKESARPPGTTTGQPKPGPPALDIERYLNVNDVRRITGDRTLAPAGRLSGIQPSETYNSKYFAPPVRTNFGVSLQVWREKTRRDANERFRRMRRDYPNAEDTTVLPPKSFFSWWDGHMSISFADLTKRVVVSVTCSQDVCDGDQLLKLAETVKKRL